MYSDYSEQDCVIYVKVAKKVNLKYFHSVYLSLSAGTRCHDLRFLNVDL